MHPPRLDPARGGVQHHGAPGPPVTLAGPGDRVPTPHDPPNRSTLNTMDTDTTTPTEVAAGLRARAATADLRARLLLDLAHGEERQATALRAYADQLDPA